MQCIYSVIRKPYETHESFDSVLGILGDRKLVALGEVHAQPCVVDVARQLLLELCQRSVRPVLAVEYFSVAQQELVDDWLMDRIGWEDLLDEYARGPEGFPLETYKPLLEAAKYCGARIIGVMPPRSYASILARGLEPPVLQVKPLPFDPYAWPGYVEAVSTLFPRAGPMGRIPVDRLLLAQSYKDSVAASIVSGLLEDGYDVFLVMGWAHVEAPGGVVDRVLWRTGLPWEKVVVVGSRIWGQEKTGVWAWRSSLVILVPGELGPPD